MNDQPEFDAFISYRRSDGRIAANWLRVALQRYRPNNRILESIGRDSFPKTRVYIDTTFGTPNEDFYKNNLRPALLGSRWQIVLATPDLLRSPGKGNVDWVEREFSDFDEVNSEVRVIVARALGDTIPGELPSFIFKRYPNVGVLDIRGINSLRFLWPPTRQRLHESVVRTFASIHDVPQIELPILLDEERRRVRKQFRMLGVASFLVLFTIFWLMDWGADQNRKREIADWGVPSGMLDLGEGLQSLSLSLSSVEHLRWLPSSIKDLEIDLRSEQEPTLREIPESVSTLSLYMRGAQFFALAEIPQSISTLTLQSDLDGEIPDFSKLPESVKTVNLNLSIRNGENFPKMPKSVEKLTLSIFGLQNRDFSNLPASLVSVELDSNEKYGFALNQIPESVNSLTLYINDSHRPNLAAIPDTVSTLALYFTGSEWTEPLDISDSVTDLRIWLAHRNASILRGLPETLSKLTLYIYGEQVSGLRDFPQSLSDLTLYVGGESPNFESLPESIETLRLDISGGQIQSLRSVPETIANLTVCLHCDESTAPTTVDFPISHRMPTTKLFFNLENSRLTSVPPVHKSVTELTLYLSGSRVTDFQNCREIPQISISLLPRPQMRKIKL